MNMSNISNLYATGKGYMSYVPTLCAGLDIVLDCTLLKCGFSNKIKYNKNMFFMDSIILFYY